MLFVSPSAFAVPSATVQPGLIIGPPWCFRSRQPLIPRLRQQPPEPSSGFGFQDQF